MRTLHSQQGDNQMRIDEWLDIDTSAPIETKRVRNIRHGLQVFFVLVAIIIIGVIVQEISLLPK